MEDQKKKFAAPFTPQNMNYSLDNIQAQVETFTEGFLAAKTTEFLGKMGVAGKPSGESNSQILFATPLGEIKVDFEKAIEFQYLGVAATFSFKNRKGDDEEPFFVVFLNHGGPWQDSSGHVFTGGAFERPQLHEFVHLMQRVLSKRLEIQDAKLRAIKP